MGEPAVVPDLLRAADPDAVALIVGDQALTFGEWLAGAERVAGGLAAHGVQPGDRVALVFPNREWADYAVCYMGTLMAGAVAVPLGARFAGAEVKRLLADCGAAVVLAGSEGWEADVVHHDGAPGPDDLAEIVYTSGTTGVPLGVACTHRSLLAHDVPAGAAAAGEPVTFLHAFPIGTQAGQEALRAPLRVPGLTAVVLPTFDPEELCVQVERHRVRRLQLVPAMAQLLVASGAAGRHDVSSVKRIVLSSAPAAPALFERLAEAFPGAVLCNAYALTEAGAARTLAEWDPARPTSVGPPVGATEVKIVEGEIWLRRPGTPSRWYFNNPDATAAVFVDGWVRSGDLGHLDAAGDLHLLGRAKDVVITGGANVSPVEVEHVLASHPRVIDAAVFGVPHPVLGEDLAAAVVVRQPVGERELQDLVRSQLAEHKVPHRIEFVDELPHNPSGKVLKGELRQRFSARPAPYVAPAGDTQSLVASVWQEVLDISTVGADDDFLALGGHSLAAAQIAARLNDLFGVDLGAGVVFERPTVKELAALLE